MILALLIFSLITTGAAVWYGICGYLMADRKASPVDPWNAPPRTAAISQVERLTASMKREVLTAGSHAHERTAAAHFGWRQVPSLRRLHSINIRRPLRRRLLLLSSFSRLSYISCRT